MILYILYIFYSHFFAPLWFKLHELHDITPFCLFLFIYIRRVNFSSVQFSSVHVYSKFSAFWFDISVIIAKYDARGYLVWTLLGIRGPHKGIRVALMWAASTIPYHGCATVDATGGYAWL